MHVAPRHGRTRKIIIHAVETRRRGDHGFAFKSVGPGRPGGVWPTTDTRQIDGEQK